MGRRWAPSFCAGWNACREAMLQGVEPVSQTYELPQTQFEQVADLYEMQFDDGRTCAFHTDGTKAVQWLLACDGNKVQEYVRIERYQEAVIGNSPVIPDGYTLVPVEPTDEMIAAAMNCEDVLFNSDESFCVQFGNIYEAMLAAAPQQEASDGK
ncbi:eaa protein [Salmonella enterica]|nr:eaa protein [Salmonella enterica]